MMCCTNRIEVADEGIGEVAFDGVHVLGAAERRVGQDDVVAVALAELAHVLAEGVRPHDARDGDAVQHAVHHAQQVGQRLLLLAEEGGVLQLAPVGSQADVMLLHVAVGFHQEPGRPAAGS